MPALYLPFVRVSMNGVITSGTNPGTTPLEIFSMNFALAKDSAVDGLPDEPLMNAVAEECKDYFERSGTCISALTYLKVVKFAAIGEGGSYLETPYEVPYNSPGGGPVAVGHPTQISYRVSLRGPDVLHPVRGGWFVPTPIPAMDPDWEITEAAAIQAATSASLMINQINDIVEAASYYVSIAHLVRETTGDTPPDGSNPQITQIRVGRRFDVIRKRANAMPERYVLPIV